MPAKGSIETVPTRVLIISDTHNNPLLASDDGTAERPFKEPLPQADILIHCGDMTNVGSMDEYEGALRMLLQIDAPIKIVIPGNHDRTLDMQWMVKNPMRLTDAVDRRAACQAARDFWTCPGGQARQAGVLYLEEGIHTVPLKNGAQLTVYTNPYTPEFLQWGFAYEHNEDRFNSPEASLCDAVNIAERPVPSFSDQRVDIMITHGPPFARLDETFRGESVGCPHLLRALMRCRPLVHCFGHIHEGSGAERITWSDDAETAATKTSSTEDWKKGGWQRGLAGRGSGIEVVPTDMKDACKDRSVRVDLTSAGPRPLIRGKESLLVNAAIVDQKTRPVNAPWLILVDLPVA